MLTRYFLLCFLFSNPSYLCLFICQLLINCINFCYGFVSFFVRSARISDLQWLKQSYGGRYEWNLRWKYIWTSIQRKYVWRAMFVLSRTASIRASRRDIFLAWWILRKRINCRDSYRLYNGLTSTLQMLSYQLSEEILWVL